MLCEKCQQKKALVHLIASDEHYDAGSLHSQTNELHFCRNCADTYFASTPGKNSQRGLISLSDWYRSKLYDQLEATHPEVFDNHDEEACRRGSKLMIKFLRQQLKKDNIQVRGDAFEMLCLDFFGSYHFYDRINELKRRTR
jgi:protein-arginine kinase activator protein McsA